MNINEKNRLIMERLESFVVSSEKTDICISWTVAEKV